MSQSLSFFNPYSQGENQVTNYCELMLKLLYKESPEAFEEIVNNLISGVKPFDCLPKFSQQAKKKRSVPDLCFSQKSFEIYFETKNNDWFYNDQIVRHIDGFENENKADTRILFLLTKEFSGEEEKYGADYASKANVLLQKITFRDFLDAFKNIVNEDVYTLSKYFGDYLEEFEDYLTRNRYLDDWQQLLDVVNCKATKEEVEHGYYICPNVIKTYSHRRAKYFGAYWDKNVNYIAVIKARLIISDGEYSIAWKNVQESNEKIIALAKSKIENGFDWRKEEMKNNEVQLFLLSEPLVKLNYSKKSRGGMFASKRYFSVEAANIEELFEELNGKSWE